MTASPIDRNALGDGDGVLASIEHESRREQGAGNESGRLRDGGSRAGNLFVGETLVMALVNAAGDVAGEYRYGPYGQTRTAAETGIANPFRFSTKFLETAFASENETLSFGGGLDLYDYGFRWYHAGLGRWTARDPLGERGGLSIYGFVGNRPVGGIDIHGAYIWTKTVYESYDIADVRNSFLDTDRTRIQKTGKCSWELELIWRFWPGVQRGEEIYDPTDTVVNPDSQQQLLPLFEDYDVHVVFDFWCNKANSPVTRLSTSTKPEYFYYLTPALSKNHMPATSRYREGGKYSGTFSSGYAIPMPTGFIPIWGTIINMGVSWVTTREVRLENVRIDQTQGAFQCPGILSPDVRYETMNIHWDLVAEQTTSYGGTVFIGGGAYNKVVQETTVYTDQKFHNFACCGYHEPYVIPE